MAIPSTPQATVLSYKLYTKAANSKTVELGQVLSIDLSESRDVIYNFVIGNDPPDVASNLIPGVVKGRKATLKRVRLFSKSLLEAFGRDDQTTIASLADQNTSLDLVATLQDPNTGKTKTITFKDGFLSDVSTALNMEGDIREIQNCDFMYRDVSTTAYS